MSNEELKRLLLQERIKSQQLTNIRKQQQIDQQNNKQQNHLIYTMSSVIALIAILAYFAYALYLIYRR